MSPLRFAPPALLLFGLASGVHAQTVRQDLYITNGPVEAAAVSGDVLYLGGEFTHVGARFTGPLTPIDAATGEVQQPIPIVKKGSSFGTVYAVAPDGTGGWYVGGDFDAIDGLPRSNLAHLAPDLSVSAWNPEATGRVNVILVSGSTVYVGGIFGNVGGQSRSCIAALDATTGNATPWNPGADGFVYALALSGSTLYVGGSFTTIAGQTRNGIATNIAALDATSEAATSWNSYVRTFAIHGSTLYVGGHFVTIGGVERRRLAAFDLGTGALAGWNPNVNLFQSDVYSIATDGTRGYAAGIFSSVDGQPRDNLAAVNMTTGTALAWNPVADDYAWAIGVSGSRVLAGGQFRMSGVVRRNYLTALDLVTGQVTSWNPDPNAPVTELAVIGSAVYAAGRFSFMGGQPRNFMAAVDAISGAPTSWNPNPNNDVYTMIAGASTIYAGGHFLSIGASPACASGRSTRPRAPPSR